MRVDGSSPGEQLNERPVVEARASASLILLRDSPAGPEVLLVQRNPDHTFMGGAWVFPGGATSEEDADERETARRELEEEAGFALPAEAELVRFSRWITPAEVARRFDTHFFVADAPAGAEAKVDGSECIDARWLRPQDALDRGERDELQLVFPTIKHLEQLAAFGSVADTLAHARARRVQPVQPRVRVEGGVTRILIPGEPGYDGCP